MTDSKNYCRSDAALGHAVRMLLLGLCEPGCGYSDHDVPQGVWSAVGVEFEAFLANASKAGDIGPVYSDHDAQQVAHHWIGSRNGEGIGFWSLALDVDLDGDERAALTRLDKLAKSQGACELFIDDEGEINYHSPDYPQWEAAYESAREVYVYA